jgi:hypothetical protein
MSLIKDTWRQLVRNRLWPIALVLVGALVAVPVLLAKSPAPPAPAPTPPTSASAAADRAALEPVVARADASQSVRRRHVLGDRKDPFKPAPQPKAKVTKVTSTTTTTPGVIGTGGSTPGTTGGSIGGSIGGGTSAPPVTFPVGGTPVAVTPKPAAKHYPADSLTVRFGTADGGPKSVLKTGEALPDDKASTSNTAPILVYLGLSKDGKRALFLVDESVKADGDGHCTGADPNVCDTLQMRAGDTEFLDVTDDTGTVTAQYEFDVVAIHAKSGTGATAAKARKARVSKTEKAWAAKARTSLAGAARAGGSANIGAGVGALLGSL